MLGDTIRKLRMKKDISPQVVADASGISRGYLSNVENNVYTNPSFDVVAGFAKVFDITVDDLMREINSDNVTLDIFLKIFGGGFGNIELITKEKLLKRLLENNYTKDYINVFKEHIMSL